MVKITIHAQGESIQHYRGFPTVTSVLRAYYQLNCEVLLTIDIVTKQYYTNLAVDLDPYRTSQG